MKRSMFVLLLASVWSAGCTDPETEKRLTDLEAKVDALEQRPAGAGPAAAPAANAEEEQAASALIKEVSVAMEDGNFDLAKEKVKELRAKYPNTRSAKAAVRLEEELNVVGKDAVPLQVDKWFQGSEAETKGKATLYVFWEVWCPHCRKEVPRLAETYNKFHPQGLGMVGLTKMTRDVTDEKVEDFIKENKLPYPIAKEKGQEMSNAYGVRGIPAAAVVKDGKVIWRGHPAKLTDELISSWL
ncbi:MAG: TlpA disulfide reductase family protein [Myxococcota bacterium]